MPDTTPTWRIVEEEAVCGRQRLVFVRDRNPFRDEFYELKTLSVYEDGVVAWDSHPTDFDGLRAAFADGTLTLVPPEGARMVIAGTASGAAPVLETRLTPEMVIADLADAVDQLNGRPDSSRRCWNALLTYAAEPTPANLETVRSLYREVPEHRRIYMLGDMDQNDVPVRVLLAEPGETIPARNPERTLTVTPEVREWALGYFGKDRRAVAEAETRATADGPENATTIRVGRFVHPGPDSDPSGLVVLQNDYPAAVVHEGHEYRSVEHAYWASSTDDPDWHDRIASAEHGYEAERRGQEAPRRAGWPALRLAVMAGLMRDKFARHPQFAATLVGTGDSRILHDRMGSRFWRGDGTNGAGRLLELIRSELAAP